MTGVIIALVSGILMSVQGVFNTQVTKQTSLWVSAGWVQFTALLVCIGAWFFTGRQEVTALFLVTPRYVLLGGVIGAAITITVIQSMNSLGPAQSAMLSGGSTESVSEPPSPPFTSSPGFDASMRTR